MRSGEPRVPSTRQLVPVAVIAVIAGALLYAGWQVGWSGAAPVCDACGRAVHLASRVDGTVAGRKLTFCCAACALRASEAQPLVIAALHDHETGDALAPDQAVAVMGSNVNLCTGEHVHMDADKEASDLHYDRCSPSVLAFKDAASAERFRAQHGGVVTPFAELLAAAETRRAQP